jgi:outer membrane protein OmpA-like peptidoglycan-associated protein
MKLKLITLVYCVLFLKTFLFSQPHIVEINGSVTDVFKKSIPNVTLNIIKNDSLFKSLRTDEKGNFEKLILHMGEDYTVEYLLDGFLSKRIELNLVKGYTKNDWYDIIPVELNTTLLPKRKSSDYSPIENEFIIGRLNIDTIEETLFFDLNFFYTQSKIYYDFVKNTELNAFQINGGNLFFEFDKAELIPISIKNYQVLLKYLKDNPSKKITLEGHTDSYGKSEYNWWLASVRSNKIKNMLHQDGVEWNRITTKSCGDSKPILPSKTFKNIDDPLARQINRRVTIIIE